MRAAATILFALFCLDARGAVGVRVLFGITDQAEVKWDGSVVARGGHIASLEPWRFEGTDALRGTSWTASTHAVRLFGGRGLVGNVVQLPHVANGVVVYLDEASENTSIDVTTAQGNFSIRLSDIPFGRVQNALNNRVMVDRIPPVTRLTDSRKNRTIRRQSRIRAATSGWLTWSSSTTQITTSCVRIRKRRSRISHL